MNSSARPHITLAALFYTAAFTVILLPSFAQPSLSTWLLNSLTILAYAVLTFASVIRRPNDRRVILFLIAGCAISLTILLPRVPYSGHTGAAAYLYLAIFPLVYLTNFAVVIHMAASIVWEMPFSRRQRFFIVVPYATALLLATAIFVMSLRASNDLRHVHDIMALLTVVTYSVGGITSLVLLANTARTEMNTPRSRQLLVVFCGLLPWTLNITSYLFAPAFHDSPISQVIEAVALLLVPISFFVAILGFHLFDLGLVVRRGLIYGVATITVAGVMIATGLAAGKLIEPIIGEARARWAFSLLFFVGGILLRPAVAVISTAVDRRFFHEKIDLRRLEKSIIPELARLPRTSPAADYLVSRIRVILSLASTSLVLPDQSGLFFRVRAESGTFRSGAIAKSAVLRRDELELWQPYLADGYPRHRNELPLTNGELEGMLDLLDTDSILPITLNGRIMGLFILGRSMSGWELDSEDRERLKLIAHQVSAMLENARLLEIATIDGLTRLPRFQIAEQRLGNEIERARRSFRPLCAAMIDIDHFKRINDTWGHHAGDAVLRSVSRALTSRSRSTDIVARYGGDEFFMLFLDTSLSGAVGYLEDLRRRIEGLVITLDQIAPANVKVTISVGVCAIATAADLNSADEIIRLADSALYRAKRAGRNRVETPGLLSEQERASNG
ncbi:MAG TPA: sensor domain-containing diguanylate cyclase [Thermoanaerobaculia bacterium]|nr:sensor domain-containing diguanylate cyclase [Thermoanaerobaculia bacterium]